MAKYKKTRSGSTFAYLTVLATLISILTLSILSSKKNPEVNQVTLVSKTIVVPVASPLPADLNQDGTVNLYDLNILRASTGSQGKDLPADLNRDDVVDRRDEALLKRSYAR